MITFKLNQDFQGILSAERGTQNEVCPYSLNRELLGLIIQKIEIIT